MTRNYKKYEIMRNYEINYEIYYEMLRNYEINIMTMTSGEKDDVILPSVLRNYQNLGFFSRRFRFWKMGASHFQMNPELRNNGLRHHHE